MTQINHYFISPIFGPAFRSAMLAVGVSFAAFAFANQVSALMTEGDDQTTAPEKIEKKKRVIKVLKPGEALKEQTVDKKIIVRTVDKDKKGRIVVSNSHIPAAYSRIHIEKIEQAKESIESSLSKMQEKLSKAKNEYERQAINSAIESLNEAKISLDEQSALMVDIDQEFHSLSDIHVEAITEALAEVNLSEEELIDVKVELMDELAEARIEIQEALNDLDLEFIVDEQGEFHELRVRALKQAELSLKGMEEKHIEALKRAEADLKRTREELERKLAEKQKHAAKQKQEK